ncbi:MAG: dTDP-4-dehydrorhamnose 3,5-epimerase [Chitinophagaceae bacterium]|nr:MAG: dTDP-4-dehydrorhamnose 3,5-epimerase [Chitinophagaceae bacterium]
MKIEKTFIEGLLIIEPKIFSDSRGYFFEAYNEKLMHELGIENKFVQDNQSFSTHGVIRGLHYQIHPKAQSKLVRVLKGSILDVAVDIRKKSPTYGQHFSIELSAENNKQLLIPAGFAHGFSVLSEDAIVMYKCDEYYHKESEAGIIFNDTELNIDWKIDADKAIISDKDIQLPTFKDALNNF